MAPGPAVVPRFRHYAGPAFVHGQRWVPNFGYGPPRPAVGRWCSFESSASAARSMCMRSRTTGTETAPYGKGSCATSASGIQRTGGRRWISIKRERRSRGACGSGAMPTCRSAWIWAPQGRPGRPRRWGASLEFRGGPAPDPGTDRVVRGQAPPAKAFEDMRSRGSWCLDLGTTSRYRPQSAVQAFSHAPNSQIPPPTPSAKLFIGPGFICAQFGPFFVKRHA